MNTPQMSANYETSSNFSSLGSFSIDDFDGFSGTVIPVPHTPAQSQTQFHIIVKRDDGLYKTLNALHTIFSIFAVLLIVFSFIMVFYSLITITEVAEIVSQVKEHNALPTTGPR